MTREPSEKEIQSVMDAFDIISQFVNPNNGQIHGAGWRDIHDTLARLGEYELWLGLCTLESALFDSDEPPTPTQATMFELFNMVYEDGIEAI